MNAANSSEEVDHNRWRFLGSATYARLCLLSPANAETTTGKHPRGAAHDNSRCYT